MAHEINFVVLVKLEENVESQILFMPTVFIKKKSVQPICGVKVY